jgi:hypothetical protein
MAGSDCLCTTLCSHAGLGGVSNADLGCILALGGVRTPLCLVGEQGGHTGGCGLVGGGHITRMAEGILPGPGVSQGMVGGGACGASSS